MFDFAWTEIALIGVVALIAIGPKDLPVAIKTVAGFVKKARRMAGEFQGHVDEMVREANLHEVRDQISQLRSFDLKGQIAKAVDGDGTLRSAFNENPMMQHDAYKPPAEAVVDPLLPQGIEPPAPHPAAPAFIPPTADIVAPAISIPPATPQAAPAFVPPGLEPQRMPEPHKAD